MFLRTLCISSALAIAKINAASWGYEESNGPATWPDPLCQTGTAQSPIDLTHNTTYVDNWLPFALSHYEKRHRHMFVSNNGHTATVTLEVEGSNENLPKVTQGNLPGIYELAQFHFHWGWYHNRGSEHEIHGRRSAAELHFVHYNIRCGRTLGDALANCGNDPEALAVLGVMIEEGDENEAFDDLLHALHLVEVSGAQAHFKPLILRDLMPYDLNEFWRYQGSLTTPGNIGGNDCAELVVWTVFKNKITLSRHQLEKFFQLKTAEGTDLKDNYRPPQPLLGREVWFANLDLHCHDHDEFDWKKDHPCHIAHRETRNEFGFNSAVHACIGYHYGHSARQGLIPVGKLRCLRNRYMYDPMVQRPNDDHFCNRFFRVNAMKDDHGEWREYPSGRRVSFSHFPEFHELHGSAGDTLIWDALENRLYIDDAEDKYHALCYREEVEECCSGAENGHACSDAGDCLEGVCYCDDMFRGNACEDAPLKNFDLFVAPNQLYDVASDTYCTVADYITFVFADTSLNYPNCDYVFGKAVCCGGEDGNSVITDICGFYDTFDQQWKQFHDMPKVVTKASATVAVEDGRDMAWFLFGGVTKDEGGVTYTDSDQVYRLEDNLIWTTVDTVMPRPRSGTAVFSVQINDCEIALVGGESNSASIVEIDIYNFKENTWRTGPELPSGSSVEGVGKVMNKETYHTIVVMNNGVSAPLIWDVQYDAIASLEQDTSGLPSYWSDVHELDDNTLIILSDDDIYKFTLTAGLEALPATSLSTYSSGQASILAPRNYFTCLP